MYILAQVLKSIVCLKKTKITLLVIVWSVFYLGVITLTLLLRYLIELKLKD